MILAAGLGTRLHPLTIKRPKALVPVMNRPMIAWVIDYLKGHGATEIIVNAHHHGHMLLDYIKDGSSFGIRMEGRFEPEILGTGGGVRNVSDFWDHEPFFVANADILTDMDLSSALKAHRQWGCPATLILHDRPAYSKVLLNSRGVIEDISRDVTPGRLSFAGIHIIEPWVLDLIKPGVFSDIIDCYRELIKRGMPPKGFVCQGHRWHDVGTVESYLKVHEELCLMGPQRFVYGGRCLIHPSARLLGWAVLGSDVVVEKGAAIERSVIWDGAKVRAGVRIIGSVVSSGVVIDEDVEDGVV
jgi:NDP-sugar pyrophosphorylase family protein